jgi:UPF0755 protein
LPPVLCRHKKDGGVNSDFQQRNGQQNHGQQTNDQGRVGQGNVAKAGRPLRSPQKALQPDELPPPPKRSRHARHGIVVVFNTLISLLVLVASAGFAVLYFSKLRFEEPGPLQIARTVVIREGSSLTRIAQQLESAGIVDSAFLFRTGVRAYENASELQAGEYAFNPHMSMHDVMETLRSGKAVLHRIGFPEGLTSHQIFERLRENEVLVGELPDEMPPEGSLMPDTYPFQRGTTRKELVEQMKIAQQRFLDRVWATRIDDLPIETQQELVTLASIVEKETARADERPRVAGVFINRLKRGMRLQSDPTIIYGIYGGEGKPADKPIYRSDIDKATAYNTYHIDGLPPGPIANPGRAAMEAVANPSRTDELYFVADGTGGHAFAETLEEHNENVRRWREIENRLKAEAERQRVSAGESAAEAEDPTVIGQ